MLIRKKVFVAVFTILALLSLPVLAMAKDFPDLPGDHWARWEIILMSDMGIITGAVDGNFYPERSVTRAEFATMAAKALKLPVDIKSKPNFTDVNRGHWAFGFIQAVSKAGFIMGYKGQFRPNDKISRQEMAVIVMKISEKYGYGGDGTTDSVIWYKDGNTVAEWAMTSVSAAISYGYLLEVKDTVSDTVYRPSWSKRELRPAANATRAEAAYAICKMSRKAGLI